MKIDFGGKTVEIYREDFTAKDGNYVFQIDRHRRLTISAEQYELLPNQSQGLIRIAADGDGAGKPNRMVRV